MIKRVVLVGASSTGKTTIFEMLKDSLESDWEFKNESTRTVKSYGFPINEDGIDETQLAISNFHLEALLTNINTIYDRGYIDLVTYTANLEKISDRVYNYILDTWSRVSTLYTHYIYFPIEFKAVNDGVRSVDEHWRNRIDAQFKASLTLMGVPFLTVTGTPEERLEQILEFIK